MRSEKLPADPPPIITITRNYEAAYRSWKKVNNQAIALIYTICKEKPIEDIEKEPVTQKR